MVENDCKDVKKRDVVWYMPQGLCCCDVIRPIYCVIFIIVFILLLAILFIVLWAVGVFVPGLLITECEVFRQNIEVYNFLFYESLKLFS